MRERERNGVRVGQPVRDLDGTSLGRVVALYGWGFAARRGLPILFGREFVVRYDEVRGVRDGALVVARSRRDLFDLAAGEVPPTWRTPAPPEFPTTATPLEGHFVREAIARGQVGGGLGVAPAGPAAPPASPVSDDELREFIDTRGERVAPPSERAH